MGSLLNSVEYFRKSAVCGRALLDVEERSAPHGPLHDLLVLGQGSQDRKAAFVELFDHWLGRSVRSVEKNAAGADAQIKARARVPIRRGAVSDAAVASHTMSSRSTSRWCDGRGAPCRPRCRSPRRGSSRCGRPDSPAGASSRSSSIRAPLGRPMVSRSKPRDSLTVSWMR